MNKFRFIILIIFIFLLSGCSLEYNINIDNDVIYEDNVVYIENANSSNIENIFENMVSKYTGPTNSLGMYDSSIINEEGDVAISYKNAYSFSEYNFSSSFSSCYDSYKLGNDGENIIIATSKEFKCFHKYDELDEVVINLTTNYKVEESNADSVDKNKYTWIITKDNANNKNIYININTNVVDYKKEKKFTFNVFMLSIVVALIIGLIILFLKSRSNKVNKI